MSTFKVQAEQVFDLLRLGYTVIGYTVKTLATVKQPEPRL